MGLLTVRDEWSKIVGHRFLNSQICLWLGSLQFAICCWGIAQHANSYFVHSKVLHCDFENGFHWLHGVDAIIFDAGLLNALWGIRGCVAEYLDGGFGRLGWCVLHALSLMTSLPFAFSQHPKPCYLWPLLIQQSAYGIGLLILSLATLPRVLPIFMEAKSAPVIPLIVYLLGTSVNFFLLYVYWHWYWYVDSMWNSVVKVPFGARLENANNRSRRDAPRHDPEGPPEETVMDTEVDDPKANGDIKVVMNGGHRVSIAPVAKIIDPPSPTVSVESEILPAVWPPPPIVATRLDQNSSENRELRRQERRERQKYRSGERGRSRSRNRISIEEDEVNGNIVQRPLLNTIPPRGVDQNLNPYDDPPVRYRSARRLRFENTPDDEDYAMNNYDIQNIGGQKWIEEIPLDSGVRHPSRDSRSSRERSGERDGRRDRGREVDDRDSDSPSADSIPIVHRPVIYAEPVSRPYTHTLSHTSRL